MTPAERQRAYRARKAEAEGRTLGTIGRPKSEHGPSAYNRGCRCEVCRAANADRQRRYRECGPYDQIVDRDNGDGSFGLRS